MMPNALASGGATFSVCLGMKLRLVALQEKSQEDASPSYCMRAQEKQPSPNVYPQLTLNLLAPQPLTLQN